MTGIEGGGEAVTGGSPARADQPAEPAAPGNCLNCAAPLEGDYCHRCGQAAHIHRTFGAFWHDVAHSVLHLDGKFWRTLPMLAWRPGELTRRYVEGERARFLSPLAMFLFSVFLMFAAINTLGSYAYRDRSPSSDSAAVDQETPTRPETVAELEREFRAEREENLAELRDLGVARERLLAAGRNSAPIDSDIAEIRNELALDARLFEQAATLQRAEDRRAARHRQPIDGVMIHPEEGLSLGWLDEAYGRAKRNPSLLVYKLQTNAYKYSWALIPITVPLLWLLFLHRARYRRQYRAYDHTVFVTYSLAFASLFAVAYTMLKLAGMTGTIALLPFAVLPIHLYRQLRGAYRLSAWSALWRTGLLVIFAFVAGGLFFMLLLMLGVLG